MIDEPFTLLAVMIGAVLAAFVAIAALASCTGARASRPFHRDPMDWHPGRFFPPSLRRLDGEGEMPAQTGRKAA